MDNSADIAAVRDTATGYYWAMVAGDDAGLRRLFDARAAIVGHYQGAFLWMGLGEFIGETQSLIGQHGVETCTVESLRLDGDLASVAIRGRYAGLWFLDHLAMVKVDGIWVVVAKTFRVVE